MKANQQVDLLLNGNLLENIPEDLLVLWMDYVSLLECVYRDDRDFTEFIAEREFES